MFGLSRFAPTLRTASLRRAFSASTSRSHATIAIAGPLGAAPELKTSQNGRQYIRYIVGSKNSMTQEMTWFRVLSFTEAEKSQNYLLGLEKGTIMHVEGEPSITSLETPEGQKKYNFNIVQRRHTVLSRPRQRQSKDAEQDQSSEQGQSAEHDQPTEHDQSPKQEAH
ncbi:Single-strand binding protein family protein [Coccidioides posadasii C735 delta SOWgp]|uniref:Single-stranded DNA-binding protein n=1 Tax=Coccidioides posadasii (strain C735) TaxID=222929 RepID=C5P7H8_COCP7|nr:Single-strand binding protein family protein [Coccidioides posadasii C735 delta SOWgp]EER27378.1 Single-strand binding protein family protein [Coccidioides posadasii C735 delta SOWgp]|eukprot:XP_003069523.1 Single-strand binding protein family protein [Coccidioides posadasii C735 delta SOWgp]